MNNVYAHIYLVGFFFSFFILLFYKLSSFRIVINIVNGKQMNFANTDDVVVDDDDGEQMERERVRTDENNTAHQLFEEQ